MVNTYLNDTTLVETNDGVIFTIWQRPLFGGKDQFIILTQKEIADLAKQAGFGVE